MNTKSHKNLFGLYHLIAFILVAAIGQSTWLQKSAGQTLAGQQWKTMDGKTATGVLAGKRHNANRRFLVYVFTQESTDDLEVPARFFSPAMQERMDAAIQLHNSLQTNKLPLEGPVSGDSQKKVRQATTNQTPQSTTTPTPQARENTGTQFQAEPIVTADIEKLVVFPDRYKNKRTDLFLWFSSDDVKKSKCFPGLFQATACGGRGKYEQVPWYGSKDETMLGVDLVILLTPSQAEWLVDNVPASESQGFSCIVDVVDVEVPLRGSTTKIVLALYVRSMSTNKSGAIR